MRIINGAELKAMQNEGKRIVVDFYADWCGPCKMLAPVMEELAESYAGQVEIVKINVDDNQDIAMEYGVMSIPNVLGFKGANVVCQSVGFKPKPAMEEFVKEVLK